MDIIYMDIYGYNIYIWIYTNIIYMDIIPYQQIAYPFFTAYSFLRAALYCVVQIYHSLSNQLPIMEFEWFLVFCY